MSRMRFAFRWYGPEDPIPLAHIRQIPCVNDIVTACYNVPSGALWPSESIAARAEASAAHGLTFSVAEGLPVHESIKLGRPERKQLLDIYCENIRRLAAGGVKVICYNFMPLFGWIRTDTRHPLPDGSLTLAYSQTQLDRIDLERDDFSLPGWHFSASREERGDMLAAYREMGRDGLWENFAFFLRQVVPVAEECGIRLAVHPDDPPLPVFGLPRIVSNAEDLRRMRALCPSPANGITLCTGSLAASPENDVIAIAEEFAQSIPFVHARNVRHTGARDFLETGHYTDQGEIHMARLLRALDRGGFDGWLRADHGRMIFGEDGQPGYGLFDRALGVSYLSGIWEALQLPAGSEFIAGNDLR